MQKGMSATGVSFVNTSGGDIDVVDITMTGYTKASYEGASINIQQLTAEGGQVDGSYLEWYDDEEDTGWYNPSTGFMVKRGEITIAAGTGLWLQANSTDEKLVSAGAVISNGADITLRPGQTLVCNPVPTEFTFDNTAAEGKFIAATGYNKETYEGGTIIVQQLTAEGGQVDGSELQWYDDEEDTGWYDPSTGLMVEGKTLKAGVAVWTTANSTSEKLSFPAL